MVIVSQDDIMNRQRKNVEGIILRNNNRTKVKDFPIQKINSKSKYYKTLRNEKLKEEKENHKLKDKHLPEVTITFKEKNCTSTASTPSSIQSTSFFSQSGFFSDTDDSINSFTTTNYISGESSYDKHIFQNSSTPQLKEKKLKEKHNKLNDSNHQTKLQKFCDKDDNFESSYISLQDKIENTKEPKEKTKKILTKKNKCVIYHSKAQEEEIKKFGDKLFSMLEHTSWQQLPFEFFIDEKVEDEETQFKEAYIIHRKTIFDRYGSYGDSTKFENSDESDLSCSVMFFDWFNYTCFK